MMKLQFRAFKT